MKKVNEFQKVAETIDDRDGIRDPLYDFIIDELGDGVQDINDAILRMETARGYFEAVLQALDALKRKSSHPND